MGDSERISKQNHQLHVAVSDNGIGISPDYLSNVLEPYVTTKDHGTGLGLAIVKKIVEEHDGKFSINNIEDGASASFNLTISRD